MIRLIKIEYYKLKNTKYFWIFTSLFLTILLCVPIFSRSLLNYFTSTGASIRGINLNELPFFDFIDIWQNLTYLFKWPVILIAFIPVISMANEYRNGTIKQNIIDGLSRNDLILSKVLFTVVYSVLLGVAIFLIGLLMGLLWSPVQGIEYVIEHIQFVPAFILVLIGYQIFCLLLTTLIKKSGITIVALLFYFFALEAFAYSYIAYFKRLPALASLLPLRGIANIIRNPFPKYWLQEVYTHVRPSDLLITVLYIALFTFLLFWLFNKRDIRN